MNIQTDWTRTADALPSIDLIKADTGVTYGVNEHVDCYICIAGSVREQPWNIYHKCWDDTDYDDFAFEALAASHWMLKPSKPDAPTN